MRVAETRGVLMKTNLFLALGVGLLLAVASSAMAFQDEQPKQSAPAAELQGGEAAGKSESGTEVNIPGLGSIGVLPKMDFGLELLYGANEKAQQPVEPQQDPSIAPQDDLTIRGTMRHNF